MSSMLDLLIEKSLFVRHRCEATLLDLLITYSFLRCSAVWGGKQGNILYFSSRWDPTHEGIETQFCLISASDHWPDSAPNNPNNWRSNPDLPTCPSWEPGTTSAGNLTSFWQRPDLHHHIFDQVHIQQANQNQSNQMIQIPGGTQNGQNVIMMVPNRWILEVMEWPIKVLNWPPNHLS